MVMIMTNVEKLIDLVLLKEAAIERANKLEDEKEEKTKKDKK